MVQIRVDSCGVRVHDSNTYKIPIIFGYVTSMNWSGIFRTRKRHEIPKNSKIPKHKKYPKTQTNTWKYSNSQKTQNSTINLTWGTETSKNIHITENTFELPNTYLKYPNILNIHKIFQVFGIPDLVVVWMLWWRSGQKNAYLMGEKSMVWYGAHLVGRKTHLVWKFPSE